MSRDVIASSGESQDNRIPEHIIESPLEEQQEVSRNLSRALQYLKELFDVDELSTIEGVHLRHIVEQCLREFKKSSKVLEGITEEIARQKKEQGKADAALVERADWLGLIEFDNPTAEAAARWLSDLYGIDQADILWCDLIVDETSGESYKYLYTSKESFRDVMAIAKTSRETVAKYDERKELIKKRKQEIAKKTQELESMGHRVSVHEGILEPEFKVFLNKERENVTVPYPREKY